MFQGYVGKFLETTSYKQGRGFLDRRVFLTRSFVPLASPGRWIFRSAVHPEKYMKRAKGDSFPPFFWLGFLRLAKYDHARHGLTLVKMAEWMLLIEPLKTKQVEFTS